MSPRRNKNTRDKNQRLTSPRSEWVRPEPPEYSGINRGADVIAARGFLDEKLGVKTDGLSWKESVAVRLNKQRRI